MPGAIDFHGIARQLCQVRKASRRLIPLWIAPVTCDRSVSGNPGCMGARTGATLNVRPDDGGQPG